MRIKGPKKFKDKLGFRQLIDQDDFYTEATEFEEQGERWILSDVKKTLRFYLQALEIYEKGLRAPNSTLKGTYNILYNETRLFLQVYTEYTAANGYINLLQYVNTEDIPQLSSILLPLTEIARRVEEVYQMYPTVRTWDLECNLLICYSTLLESAGVYSLSGEQVIELSKKFTQLTENSLKFQVSELSKFDSTEILDDATTEAPSEPSPAPEVDEDQTEDMEQADQITSETILEVLTEGYKFVQLLLELLIEYRSGRPSDVRLDVLQTKYLEELTTNFSIQLDKIYIAVQSCLKDGQNELAVVLEVNRGITTVSGGDVSAIESYITHSIDVQDTDLLLGKVDVLTLAISCLKEGENVELEWNLCSLLNRLLTKIYSKISAARNDIISGRVKNMSDQLSRIVFQQCDVLLNSSDNELRRWQIKANDHNDSSLKTMDVLMKNAQTLLRNACTIAEKPCGLEEHIVDKLKRNYIYNQGQARLNFLTNPKQADTSPIMDLLAEHPFYSNAHNA